MTPRRRHKAYRAEMGLGLQRTARVRWIESSAATPTICPALAPDRLIDYSVAIRRQRRSVAAVSQAMALMVGPALSMAVAFRQCRGLTQPNADVNGLPTR